MVRPTARTTPLAVIAEESGVSVPTVSKVLNSRLDVAPATRERVIGILRRHGMSPRVPRARTTGLLDLRIESALAPWCEELVRSVVDASRPAGLDVVISISPQESCREWARHAIARGTDGLITMCCLPPEAERQVARGRGVPVVAVDPWSPPPADSLSVGVANWQGGLEATEHLVALGHRRIATVTASSEFDNAAARVDGYRAALSRAGLEVDEALVRRGDLTPASGYAAAQYFLTIDPRPTALFAAGDDMALGALRALKEAGVDVPGEFSVVGFDDLLVAAWVEPALTTVHRPFTALGSAAVDMVVQNRSGVTDFPHIELATTLVVRDSTAPPPA